MLFEIVARKHRVCAAIFDRDYVLSCAAWEFLKEQFRTSPGSVRGMKALFERYASDGRNKLTPDLFHHASEEHDIFQFIKGQLRVFCFIDGDCLVLTHGALKKAQKASTAEVREAVSCREKYHSWKSTNEQ